MVRVLTAVPISELPGCSSGASACTSTFWVISPGDSVKSTLIFSATCRTISCLTAVLKPALPAETV